MEPLTGDLAKCMPPRETKFDLPQVVLATMRYVENTTANNPDFHGESKLLLFKRAIHEVINFAASQNIVDKDAQNVLLQWVTNGTAMIEGMVEAFIAISHNPQMIQLSEDVRAGCALLCRKSKKVAK